MDKGKISLSNNDEDIDKIVSEYKSKMHLNEKKRCRKVSGSMPNLFGRKFKQIITKVKRTKSTSAIESAKVDFGRIEIEFKKCDWAKKLNSKCHMSTEANELHHWLPDKNFGRTSSPADLA